MQTAIREACAVKIEIEPCSAEPNEWGVSCASGARRWIQDALDWLDRYWDDPELRTGFWRSGW